MGYSGVKEKDVGITCFRNDGVKLNGLIENILPKRVMSFKNQFEF